MILASCSQPESLWEMEMAMVDNESDLISGLISNFFAVALVHKQLSRLIHAINPQRNDYNKQWKQISDLLATNSQHLEPHQSILNKH